MRILVLGSGAREHALLLAELGCTTLRSTLVGRMNPGSVRQFTRFGGRPLHATAYYRKALER